jgi:hypothetical protein
MSLAGGATTGNASLSAGTSSGDVTIAAGSISGTVTLTCGGDITLTATGSGARIATNAGYVVSGSDALSIAIAADEVAYICDEGVTPARAMIKEDTGNWPVGYAAVNVITSSATATNATTNLSFGSFTIPANTLRVGSVYKITGYYVYTHTAAATPTLTLELLLAGAVVATVVCTPIATATDFSGRVEAWVTVRTVGAGGTAMTCVRHDSNVADPTIAQHSEGSTGIATTAIDTTAAIALTARIRMTTAVASNTLTVPQGFIERLA